MSVYLAAIFVATVLMLLLHVAEWRTASTMAAPSPLLAIAAIYHWGGLAFGERSGLFEKLASGGDAASGGSKITATSAIAVLDLAEMAS